MEISENHISIFSSPTQQLDRNIKRRLAQIVDAINHPLGTIMEVELPELRVALLTHDYKPGEDIEYPIAELRKNFNMEENIFLGKIGISVAYKDMKAKKFDRYNSIFMILEEDDLIPAATATFPAVVTEILLPFRRK